MSQNLHTVCETHSFRRAGDEIPGTGGYRKFRVAGRGKGKSGGYRTRGLAEKIPS